MALPSPSHLSLQNGGTVAGVLRCCQRSRRLHFRISRTHQLTGLIAVASLWLVMISHQHLFSNHDSVFVSAMRIYSPEDSPNDVEETPYHSVDFDTFAVPSLSSAGSDLRSEHGAGLDSIEHHGSPATKAFLQTDHEFNLRKIGSALFNIGKKFIPHAKKLFSKAKPMLQKAMQSGKPFLSTIGEQPMSDGGFGSNGLMRDDLESPLASTSSGENFISSQDEAIQEEAEKVQEASEASVIDADPLGTSSEPTGELEFSKDEVVSPQLNDKAKKLVDEVKLEPSKSIEFLKIKNRKKRGKEVPSPGLSKLLALSEQHQHAGSRPSAATTAWKPPITETSVEDAWEKGLEGNSPLLSFREFDESENARGPGVISPHWSTASSNKGTTTREVGKQKIERQAAVGVDQSATQSRDVKQDEYHRPPFMPRQLNKKL